MQSFLPKDEDRISHLNSKWSYMKARSSKVLIHYLTRTSLIFQSKKARLNSITQGLINKCLMNNLQNSLSVSNGRIDLMLSKQLLITFLNIRTMRNLKRLSTIYLTNLHKRKIPRYVIRQFNYILESCNKHHHSYLVLQKEL